MNKSLPSLKKSQPCLKEIGKLQPLSSENEARLQLRFIRVTKAIDTLVKANLRFVVSVARNYQNQRHVSVRLINEGSID